MELKFNCLNPDCRRRIAVDVSRAGASIQCPACGFEQQAPRSRDVHFYCTHEDCGQHIVVDVAESGRVTRCPGCGQPVRIPGPPPHSKQGERVERPKHVAALMQGSRNAPRRKELIAAIWRLACGWGIGAIIVAAMYLQSHLAVRAALPRNLEDTAAQIYSRDFHDAPIANVDGTKVLYTYLDQEGARVFKVDPRTLERTEIDQIEGSVGPKDFKWIGWSPSQLEAAYFLNRGGRFQPSVMRQKELVLLRLVGPDVSKRVLDVSALGVVESGSWVSTHTLALSSYSDGHALFNLKTGTHYGDQGLQPLRRIQGTPFHWLVVESDESLVYAGPDYLLRLDVLTGQTNRLMQFDGGRIHGLDYSPETRKYLFSIRGEKRENCFVYEYEPRGSSRSPLKQLTTTRSTNARWIMGGTGIAYVGTNHLGILTREPELRTNLFVGGTVPDYSVSHYGDKLYAVAAERRGLITLWEYDIQAKSLRNLLPLAEGVTFLEPVEAIATNARGEPVPYYYVPPARMDPQKKYPVVLDANLANRYDQSVQFLANSGVFFVSAGPFGITDWRSTPRHQETLAIYKEIVRHPNVDPQRIYLCGMSLSTGVASDLVSAQPELWRGVILLSPVALPRIGVRAAAYPSVFISIGDRDTTGYREKSEAFVLEACRNRMPAHLDYQHAPHAYATPELMQCYRAMARFILTDE